MKFKVVTFLLPLFFALNTFAQLDDRLNIDPNFAPFYHGVASGDPLSNAVVIWTRISPQQPINNIEVSWRMALDTAMTQIVKTGTFITNAERDYTVKVDVQNLSPNTTYYFDFFGLDKHSIIGRTKTTPVDDQATNLRFAIVSCSSMEHGYFNAYEQIAARNDIDAVVHLGDYIYEYEANGYGAGIEGRTYLPENEIITLDDYRLRYSHYRLDVQLKAIHQQYPFITTWDDHEFTDNAYKTGANNHQPATEGDWEERKLSALKAYKEWMPVREFDYTNIYRTVQYGNLLDLHLLDTRVSERDEQAATGSIADIYSADRKLIGDTQFNWLTNQMANSTAKWQIIGQQVMFAPLRVAGVPINTDQWDGYNAARQRIIDFVKATPAIENFVVLTGDIHSSWAQDIPDIIYEPITKTGSIGVEFVCTSITSPGLDIPLASDVIKLNNPHMRYVDLVQKGFMILNVNAEETQADWYYTAIDEITTDNSFGAGYKTIDGNNYVEKANDPSESPFAYPAPAPKHPVDFATGVQEVSEVVIFGVYPNPFENSFVIQYNLENAAEVNMAIYDTFGKEVKKLNPVNSRSGVNYIKVDALNLPKGTYVLQLEINGKTSGQAIIKK